MNHSAAVRREPEVTIVGFEQVVDDGEGEPVRETEAVKLGAVEPADAAVGADPQQSTRVREDALHAVVAEPIGRGEKSERQLAGIGGSRARHEGGEDQQRATFPHRDYLVNRCSRQRARCRSPSIS